MKQNISSPMRPYRKRVMAKIMKRLRILGRTEKMVLKTFWAKGIWSRTMLGDSYV